MSINGISFVKVNLFKWEVFGVDSFGYEVSSFAYEALLTDVR